MELSLAANFDERLLEGLHGSPVTEVYGRYGNDRGGGGRANYLLAPVGRRRFEEYVAAVHRQGMAFNYLINAACFGNREFTRGWQRNLNRLLDWLSDLQVEVITVSIPFVLELIRARYPHFRTKVGVYAHVVTPQQARHWEALGADCITVESPSTNREFARLRAIREAVKCDLQLLANSNCLLFCPFARYHALGLSHASQSGGPLYIDYCLLRCSLLRLAEPMNYLRSEWIRPEDVPRYEAIGYHSFKLTERGAPTEVLLTRVRAYAARRYDGNLLDLTQPFGFRTARSQTQPAYPKLWELRAFLRPRQASPLRLLRWRELAQEMGMLYPLRRDPPVVVDNRALDGFLDPIAAKSCAERDCATCGHCTRTAARAVQVDPEYRERCLTLGRTVLNDLVAGGMWGIAPRAARYSDAAIKRSDERSAV